MIVYTKKQGQYLAFIHAFTKLNGKPPSEMDMQVYFRSTPAGVHQMVKQLAAKGLIRKFFNTPRSIKVMVPVDQLPELGEGISGKVDFPVGNWSQARYFKAYRFAAEAHHGQLFPGTDLPYLMHLSFVSIEILGCLGIEKQHNGDLALQCALLHDVLEDTGIPYSEIEKTFGQQVAQGVLALTKMASLPKSQAMQDSLMRIRQQPREVWLVKLADRIANLASPPQYWDQYKKARYRFEAVEIHQALYEASEYLSERLLQKIDDYQRYL